jgi:predicted transcriptional regulator
MSMVERPRKATRLTVSLEEQDYRTLNEIALARDASISWVIRQAIRQFIEADPRKIDQPSPPNSLPSDNR